MTDRAPREPISAAAGRRALPLNTWSHLAATYDGTTLRIYGERRPGRTATVRPAALPASANPLRIGGNLGVGRDFKGRIDEVRIYNRALSAAEMRPT